MDKTKIMQQLMATFLEELEEHLRHFNQDLLALEKNPPAEERAERFTTLFRAAHSLKGAARSVNQHLIEKGCHHLEDILAKLRDGAAALSPAVFEVLFAAVDAIEEASMRLREQQDLADAPLSRLLPRLETFARDPTGASVPQESAAPAVAATPQRIEQPPPAASEPSAASTFVRVPAEKLDALLDRVGELLVAKRRVEARLDDLHELAALVDHWRSEWKHVGRLVARAQGDGAALPLGLATKAAARHAVRALRQNGAHLRRLDKTVERLTRSLASDSRLLDHVIRPLDEEVHRVRMLPFSDACAGLDRMIRDLAQAKDKEVDLRIEGGAVELDRSVLEGLKDPLRHLVRNAVDHGVETSAQRASAGKRRRASIKVSAALRGGHVEVHVADDGHGIDLDRIRAQARRRNIDEPADERELARLIFLPGFSTASIISDVSGRGVGLDIVKSRVEALHGTVDLTFTPGQGTRFTLNVPLTLTTLRAVLVAAGGQTYAFAGANVHKMVHVNAGDIRTVAGREVLQLGDAPLPLVSLAAALQPKKAAETPQGRMPALIVVSGTSRMAFIVDELLSEQEILIKNLGTRIRKLPWVAGATLLPSGRIALVLNAANLIRSMIQHGPGRARRETPSKEPATPPRRRLLVVEDSVTTRTLMKSILEAAGYDVVAAIDGQAAWQYLQQHEVDLVVSDVDMPNMDGFDLTTAIRGAERFRALPVILVTARESESDKARGIDVGANAYLVKSDFEQRSLLETIAQLL